MTYSRDVFMSLGSGGRPTPKSTKMVEKKEKKEDQDKEDHGKEVPDKKD